MTVGTSFVEANGLNDGVAVPSDAVDGSAGVAEKAPVHVDEEVPPGLSTLASSDNLQLQGLETGNFQMRSKDLQHRRSKEARLTF